MLGNWFAKGILTFLLILAVAGLAHGQTKSADLPIPQSINCMPANAAPATPPAILPGSFWISYWREAPEGRSQPFDLVQGLASSGWAKLGDYESNSLIYALTRLPMLLADPLGYLWELFR